jgi:hypothetical protein
LRHHPFAVLVGQHLRLLHRSPPLDNMSRASSMLSDAGQDNRIWSAIIANEDSGLARTTAFFQRHQMHI